MVAQLLDIPLRSDEVASYRATASNVSVDHINAIKNARRFLSSSPRKLNQHLSLSSLVDLADASLKSYCHANHPVRSDLLASHCEVIAVAMAHLDVTLPNENRGREVLASIGFAPIDPVDPLESVVVLSNSLECNAGFTPPELATRICMTMCKLLKQIDKKSSFEFISHIAPFIDNITTVATSNVFIGGHGFVANSNGPNARNVLSIAYSGVRMTISFTPKFACTITFQHKDVTVMFDRDSMKTFMAIFISQIDFVKKSYGNISLTLPVSLSQARLKIGRNLNFQISPNEIVATQRVIQTMLCNPEYISWRDYRAIHFGDI